MKIIGFDHKGQSVRFLLGDDDDLAYYGDDWDDTPYEHNAGKVYDEFIKGYTDVTFPFDALVLEPCDGEWNSAYCKDDMKERRVPCIIVVPPYLTSGYDLDSFSRWAASDGIQRFYFGDEMEPSVTGLPPHYHG